MVLRAIQSTVLTGTTNLAIAAGATVTIKDAVTGLNISLWEDIAGATPESNPFTADSNGQFLVYANPARVQITVTSGGNTRIWEDVDLHGDPLGLRNKVINGGFPVWKRGTSFSASGYFADRHFLNKSGTLTCTRESTTPPVGSEFYAKFLSGAASSFGNFEHTFESTDVEDMKGKRMTLSFKIRRNSAFSSGIRATVRRNGTANTRSGGSWTVMATEDTANGDMVSGVPPTTWTQVRLTVDIPNDATANGVQIIIQQLVVTGNAEYWEIAQIEFKEGGSDSSFETRPLWLEESLCDWFYAIIQTGVASRYVGPAGVHVTTIALAVIPAPPMRGTATVTRSAAADFEWFFRNAATQSVNASLAHNRDLKSIQWTDTGVAGLTVGDGGQLRSKTGSAQIILDAELT
ncbi:hypothetical protein LCGC14_0746840 [marine sediment metagenome]|uniref:Uncharacterized protein n=1 Tax=marine sediment metagenome TaxID=412755 RepID=A0A0F9TC69_9ZZZZ